MNAADLIRDAQTDPARAADLAEVLRRLQRAAQLYGAAQMAHSEPAKERAHAALDAARAEFRSLWQRATADRSDLNEADFVEQLRAYRAADSAPELPRSDPEPEYPAYPPPDDSTLAMRRRAIFERTVARDNLSTAPELGAAWQDAERLAAN